MGRPPDDDELADDDRLELASGGVVAPVDLWSPPATRREEVGGEVVTDLDPLATGEDAAESNRCCCRGVEGLLGVRALAVGMREAGIGAFERLLLKLTGGL